MNFALKLSYSGTNYCGWQKQNNVPTIQEEIEKSVSKIFGKNYTVYGCSRTDAGVHAIEYVCMIKEAPSFDAKKLPLALNTYLPDDICVFDAIETPTDFHPRFSAIKKEYIYKVYTSRIRDPFLNQRAYMYKHELDEIQCNNIANEFVGTYDFAAFMASGSTITDTVRTIYSFDVSQQNNLFTFKVCGNGFLYNMVRIMVGTVINSYEGKIKFPIKNVIESKSRTLAGQTMPPYALYLNKVYYEKDLFS